jgi:tetratricopeptide (TPR) repeat protein
MLQLDTVTTDLLLAGLYASADIVAEAIPRYERVLESQPTPALYNTLGDSYRAVDLQRYAFLAYQAALALLAQGTNDPAVEAAAEFGMGQVERSRMNFVQAEQHFARAVELYTQIGAQDELLSAQSALEETRRHI